MGIQQWYVRTHKIHPPDGKSCDPDDICYWGYPRCTHEGFVWWFRANQSWHRSNTLYSHP